MIIQLMVQQNIQYAIFTNQKRIKQNDGQLAIYHTRWFSLMMPPSRIELLSAIRMNLT